MTALHEQEIKLTPDFAGRYPNCWGTSLFTTDTLPSLHNVQAKEFAAWLASPLYKTIEEWDEVLPGDIVALARRTSDSDFLEEVHAAVVVDKSKEMKEAMVYTKNGAFLAAEISSMQEMLDTYSQSSDKSKTIITFHRPMDALDGYLAKHSNEVVSDYLEMIRGIHAESLIMLSGDPEAPLKPEEQREIANLKQKTTALQKKIVAYFDEHGDGGDPLLAAVAHGVRADSSFKGRRK